MEPVAVCGHSYIVRSPQVLYQPPHIKAIHRQQLMSCRDNMTLLVKATPLISLCYHKHILGISRSRI